MATVEVELTAGQLLNQIRGELGCSVGRTTVWRWRNDLNIVEAPYTRTQLTAIAAYGRFKRLGCDTRLAKQRAKEWLRERGL
jgi:hypothetical protein